MRNTLLAAGLFGALACASVAQAQTSTTPAAPAATPAATTTAAASGFTDDELKAFGVAMKEVQKISTEYSPKMAGADGPTKTTLQKEMIGKMGQAVAASGLTSQKYNEISTAVEKDTALRQRLTEVLNAQPESAPAA